MVLRWYRSHLTVGLGNELFWRSRTAGDGWMGVRWFGHRVIRGLFTCSKYNIMTMSRSSLDKWVFNLLQYAELNFASDTPVSWDSSGSSSAISFCLKKWAIATTAGSTLSEITRVVYCQRLLFDDLTLHESVSSKLMDSLLLFNSVAHRLRGT